MLKLNEFFNGYNRGQAADRNNKDCVALFAMLQPISPTKSNASSAADSSSYSESSTSDVNNTYTVHNNSNNQKNYYDVLYGAKKQPMTKPENSNTNSTRQKRDSTNQPRVNSIAEEICIATTHIYWNPKYIDVKMKQIKQVLLRLAVFNPSLRNTILCGGTISTLPKMVILYSPST